MDFNILKVSKLCLLASLFWFYTTQNVMAQPGSGKPDKSKSSKSPKKDTATTPSDPLSKKQPDFDNDGVIDELDKCPNEKGVIQYDGCPMPDSDSDGIADDLDECPMEPGLVKYKGCPAGDRDGDKINDDEDKCPDSAGLARFDGCPTRDTDGDGVNDDQDKCVNIPGPMSTFGCPATRPYRKILKMQDGKKKSASPSRKIKD